MPCLTLYLLNQVNAGLQVQAKVNEDPLDAFLLVFLLLQDKHVVVEKLLQFLVGEVDAQLLEAVELQEQKRAESEGGAPEGKGFTPVFCLGVKGDPCQAQLCSYQSR